ncbi:related to DUF726 domain protein [Cephalotrichum gorgonifer]|uniref:Related to DUF726 domain protein n=1 Tax=Cephalotrichum gorgonifer TaxID=2041049 RepID=A0AAE8MQR8_9PEZI|nr:related to DUF726 domain protein [Cephalotrichum gorgonifer]
MAAAGPQPEAGPANSSDPKPSSTSPAADSDDLAVKPTSSSIATNGTPDGTPANSSTPEKPANQNLGREATPSTPMANERDEFGLPIRQYIPPNPTTSGDKANQDAEQQKSSGGGDGATGLDGDGPLTPVPVPGQGQGQPVDQVEGPAAKPRSGTITSTTSSTAQVISEFSHQPMSKTDDNTEDDDQEWQEMPSYARFDMYDDNDKLIAREHDDGEDEKYGYQNLGGAGRGYTRVVMDDDAESATSMDENTQYLFKDLKSTSAADEDDDQRDAVSQMQATKELLTEGQRVAYVGVVRLELYAMVKELEDFQHTKRSKKWVNFAAEHMKMLSQKMMIRLYAHMDISPAEQVMIEQLAEHGVLPTDLTPVLMANSRVNNPMAEKSPRSSVGGKSSEPVSPTSPDQEVAAEPPPPYKENESENLPDVRTPSQLPTTSKLDIDLRWTVLCDLFLVLIADSNYDARARTLLERVAKAMDIPWIDICRFEKRVTDALEMQQAAEKENWNEDEHMEERRKMALKRRYVMMGLATVGGGLVIGLSAGLLAPVIGAGLAAGFTTIGVGGTSGFLAGAGGAAVITSSAAASGSIIGVRAAGRRTGAVKTFEYRPLHNNKRVNLIITVSGWMTGKVDDVRLPYSTVDSVMGDLYSVLWEPEMLRSMGDTINILATEALTQGLQQVLGSTILMSLMAALQLPIVLTKLSYLIDNPWAVSLDRATSAGLILADSIIDRNLGTRPITLVGYSLGSRVIYSCLQELARKGACGLVQNVYLFGSPVVVKKDEVIRAKTVVSGRFVNAYHSNDWILGYLFRLTNGGISRIAGLAPIEDCPFIENINVTEMVKGHMDYRTAMPRLLRECGWLVESDEFTEIEDPDPDNHQERQRELISEIEAARRELEKEGKEEKGGAFKFWRKKKALEKAEWEVYEDTLAKEGKRNGSNGDANSGVLFDVEAIRAELAKEKLEVKELQSTLPPMKLDIRSPQGSPVAGGSVRESKSTEFEEYHSPGGSSPGKPSPARTPTLPKNRELASSPYYQEAHEPQDEIQMTFDTSFHEKPVSPPPPQPPAKDVYHPHPPSPQAGGARSPLPKIEIADPWADPDDEDFGKEKEMQLTFA